MRGRLAWRRPSASADCGSGERREERGGERLDEGRGGGQSCCGDGGLDQGAACEERTGEERTGEERYSEERHREERYSEERHREE
ncbi:MAG: hypothetical protein R3F14_27600 [Polyangiaceae bacterium]